MGQWSNDQYGLIIEEKLATMTIIGQLYIEEKNDAMYHRTMHVCVYIVMVWLYTTATGSKTDVP